MHSHHLQAIDCNLSFNYYKDYIEKGLNFFGFLLNLVNVYVFSQHCMHKNINGNAIKYLLLKSCMDTFLQLRESVLKLILCKNCFLARSYGVKLSYWLLYYYIGSMAQLISIMCQVMANFDRYAHLTTNTFKLYKRKKSLYKPIMLMMVLASMILYLYELVEKDIIETKNYVVTLSNSSSPSSSPSSSTVVLQLTSNDSRSILDDDDYTITYEIMYTSQTDLAKWIHFFDSILKDFLASIVIFILNLLIINLMLQALLNKRRLQGLCDSHRIRQAHFFDETSFSDPVKARSNSVKFDTKQQLMASDEKRTQKLIQKLSLTNGNFNDSSSSEVSSPCVQLHDASRRISRMSIKYEHTLSLKYNKIESNLSMMLILNGFLVIIGHFSASLQYLPVEYLNKHRLVKCYALLNLILLHLSYTLQFFLYFLLNNKFRTILISKITCKTKN